MFRQAVPGDLDQIAAIYDAIHTEEETGRATIGWIRAIYPTPPDRRPTPSRPTALYVARGGRGASSPPPRSTRRRSPNTPVPPGAGTTPRNTSSSCTRWWWTPAIRAGAAPPALYTSTRTWAAKRSCTALRHGHQRAQRRRPLPLRRSGLPRGGHRVLRLQRHPRHPAGLSGKIIVSCPTETRQKNRPPNEWFGGLVLLSGFHYP